ncbi:MAG: HEAT repeat domain-containing protein [Treponema sp.]|nr:HEAT repeat domain-containing protein [Treponema sp.]
MKRAVLAGLCMIVFCSMLAAEDVTESTSDVPDQSGTAAVQENTPDDSAPEEKAEAGTAVVPAAKRPAAPDKEKCDQAAAKDDSPDSVKAYKETLMYGISPEIVELLKKFIANDDPRFVDEVYDLFHSTKSAAVREKIIEYFTHFKDPCIEDYAVNILNDPYDTNADTVSLVFTYISEVKCTAAIPAVITLIDADNATFFQDALTTLGNIGGPPEAVYLAEYMDRDDLTVPQKQALAQVLGKIHAVQTWKKLAALAQNKDENTFVRMYAAESIGEMQKSESVPILISLYEERDPNLRQYVIRGLANYPGNKDAEAVIIQGIKDEYYKVRLESISAVEKLSLKNAVPYLIYRTKAESEEQVVKNACYPVIAFLNTSEGNDFLVSLITDKKTADAVKGKAVDALIKDNNAGEKEILELAGETLKDDRRKQLRYTIGKQLAASGRPSYAQICREYILSKDAATVSLGLDMYKKGSYSSDSDAVKSVAEDKRSGINGKKARKILGIPEESPASDVKTAAAAAE